ncbi:twin arginine-targeting protein translocase, TatA/E family [Methylophaga lonarensis MPL]|uniref:Sec-independent protein translocase protein TatA n=1 Tax=Methylophaga lonarensis MPL TaxID=1286106 RepID=M7NXM7_9GAMM|nr:twin-arginine translocase TatA/TatE family subunit [Methylophaga lonarensis]EMR11941.1 twin arginine-targeting protein translocase, TatA/E family [Methylophaga lonarensis MPL]
MGFGGISVWQLLIILVIVVLLFGTKKLRSLGGDLGSAIRNFKSSLREGEQENNTEEPDKPIEHQKDSTDSQQQQRTADKDKNAG